MKVGLRPKKFFQDIVVIPRSEMERARLEIEEHKGKKQTQSPRPLVFDTIQPEDRIKKRIIELWQKEKRVEKRAFSVNRVNSLEEVAERVLGQRAAATTTSSFRIRSKTLFKNSLTLFLKFSLVAVMIYNAVSLYYDKNWLVEKINNLALASRTRFAFAQESLLNFDQAKSSDEIEKAGLNLLQIKAELLNQGEYSYILPSHPLLNNELTLGQNMLELGLLVKETNSDFNTILDDLTGNSKDKNLWQKTQELKPAILRIEDRINRADIILKSDQDVKKALGTETSGKIESIISKSKVELDKINQVIDALPLILGANGDNRYLVLFMNNAEMTPGGGFPGNYGVVSFENNNYKDIYINDIYHLQWLIREKLVKLNEDKNLRGLDPRVAVNLPSNLYLPDPVGGMISRGYYTILYANWSLDFRENAARAVYLYKNVYEQGEVNGVIALTPNVIEDILGVVGPIKMDDYGVELTKENFRETIEYKVEFDNPFKIQRDSQTNPKQVLVDFGPKFTQKISEADSSQKIKIMEVILNNIQQKQILLYHNDPKVQKLISDLKAAGEVKEIPGDYLAVYHLNINAQKNGQAIERSIKFASEVNKLGFTNNELNLTILFNENNPRPLHQRERSYVEIVVPAGSRIREAKLEGKDFASEIDYFQEAGHTVFGFWIELNPGEAKNTILKYQAPLVGYPDSQYSLTLGKQPGAEEIRFEGKIKFEDSSKYGSNPKIIKETIDTDKVIKF